MNCVVLAWWDRELDAAMRQPSLSRCCPDARRWLWPGVLGVMMLAVGAWALDARLAPLAGALWVSTLALGEVGRSEASDGRRVLADAVLLAPVLFWL